MADANARIEALEKQNGELLALVDKLKEMVTSCETRMGEMEKQIAAGAAGGAKKGGEGKKKKEKGGGKKGGGDAGGEKKASKAEEARNKDIKAATKEGGKKGQDLAGMHDLGGMSYFAIALESCKGDWELLQCAMDGANKAVDEGADDRKGGAGELAKCFLSTDDTKHLAMYYHVPKARAETVSLDDWLAAMTVGIPGKVVERSDEFLKYEAPQNLDKELFPLKMRDQAINQSFAFLKSKKLVPEEEDSDGDMGAMYEDAGIEW
jgi:hypothetical protein